MVNTRSLNPLAAYHFPVANWTHRTINSSSLTTNQFIDTVKIFTDFVNPELHQKLIDGAVAAGFYQSPDVCTVEEMFEWCTFLKKKLEKDTLFAHFDLQRHEFRQALKQKTSYYDDLLRKLRECIELIEEEKEIELENVKVDFTPASLYHDKGDDVLARCTNMYLSRGTNTDDLKVWVENKMLHHEEIGETSKACFLRKYLEVSGGAVTKVVRTMSEERADEARQMIDRKIQTSKVLIMNILLTRISYELSDSHVASARRRPHQA